MGRIQEAIRGKLFRDEKREPIKPDITIAAHTQAEEWFDDYFDTAMNICEGNAEMAMQMVMKTTLVEYNQRIVYKARYIERENERIKAEMNKNK